MNREQLLIGLVLSVPPAVGVISAIHLTLPWRVPTAIAGGVVTFLAIFGLVYVAVEHQPPLPDEDAETPTVPGGGEED
jgi:hypothetical protein